MASQRATAGALLERYGGDLRKLRELVRVEFDDDYDALRRAARAA